MCLYQSPGLFITRGREGRTKGCVCTNHLLISRGEREELRVVSVPIVRSFLEGEKAELEVVSVPFTC